MEESGDPSTMEDSTDEKATSSFLEAKVEQKSLLSTSDSLCDNEKEMKGVEVTENAKKEVEVTENGKKEVESLNQITKSLDEIIELTSSVKLATQDDETFINAGNELEENDKDNGDETLEECKLPEDGDGETDKTSELTKKKRIVYDRDTLISFMSGARKDAIQGLHSIPVAIIRGRNIERHPRPAGRDGYPTYKNRNESMRNFTRQSSVSDRQIQLPLYEGSGGDGILQNPPRSIEHRLTLELNSAKPHKLPGTELDVSNDSTTSTQRRIVYDRDTLLRFRYLRREVTFEGINSIPPNILKQPLKNFPPAQASSALVRVPNSWKPWRNINPPKMIEEVRRATIREEKEEKKYLIQKQNDAWNALSSNKSSRFDNTNRQGTSHSTGDLPKFVPGGGNWGQGSEKADVSTDVYQIRDSGWKARRDVNSPKTIDEIQRAAIREEEAEMKRILNLPLVQPTPGPMPLLQKQKGVWNVAYSNKAARFAAHTKRQGASDSSGDLPKFAPAGGVWARGGGFPTKNNLPPRFSRLSDLTEGPAPNPSREDIVQDLPSPYPSKSIPKSRSSQVLSDEAAWTQTSPNLNPAFPEPFPHYLSRKVRKAVNQYVIYKSFDRDWFENMFPIPRIGIEEFVNELSIQVCKMSMERHQKGAGDIFKTLIKKGYITKDEVIKSLRQGPITQISIMETAIPEVTSYFGTFLSELFMDEDDLSWLLQLGEPIQEVYFKTWTKLVTQTLNILKTRHTEAIVQELYMKTQGSKCLPVQDIPWIILDKKLESPSLTTEELPPE